MVIYKRTAQGQAAALNPNSALPRKLRTLLIAIDGRTDVQTYVKSLSAFGDVEGLLVSLLNAGMIEAPRLSTVEVTAIDTTEPPSRSGETTVPTLDSVSDWERTVVNALAVPTGPNEPAWPSAGGSSPQRAPTPYAPGGDARSSLVNHAAHYQLKNAIGLMSDFVSTHMPLESIEIVLELERLSSVEQLLASLDGYESLISGIGEPARAHMAELRIVMSSSI